MDGRIKMRGERERRRKQLLDDLKESREYGKIEKEALDHTAWRTRFGRGHGPNVSHGIARQAVSSLRVCGLKFSITF